MKLVLQIAAGIVLAFFCMSLLSAMVFFVGVRAWSEQLPVLNLPQLPPVQHRSVIQAAPVQSWSPPVVRPLPVVPDSRCTSYVQGADGQRHCYVSSK